MLLPWRCLRICNPQIILSLITRVHHLNTQIVLTLTTRVHHLKTQAVLTLTTMVHHHKPKMIVLILATRNNHQVYIKIQYMLQSRKYPGIIYLASLKNQNIPQIMRKHSLKHLFKKYPGMQSKVCLKINVGQPKIGQTEKELANTKLGSPKHIFNRWGRISKWGF